MKEPDGSVMRDFDKIVAAVKQGALNVHRQMRRWAAQLIRRNNGRFLFISDERVLAGILTGLGVLLFLFFFRFIIKIVITIAVIGGIGYGVFRLAAAGKLSGIAEKLGLENISLPGMLSFFGKRKDDRQHMDQAPDIYVDAEVWDDEKDR